MCLYSLTVIEIHRGRLRAGPRPGRPVPAAGRAQRAEPGTRLVRGGAGRGGRRAARLEALAAAEQAQRHSEDDGDLLFLPAGPACGGPHQADARRARRRPSTPCASVRLLETSQGQADPAMRRWHADLAEALVAHRLPRGGDGADRGDAGAGVPAPQAERPHRADPRGGAGDGRTRRPSTRPYGSCSAPLRPSRRCAYPLEEGRTRLELGRVHVGRGDAARGPSGLPGGPAPLRQGAGRPWLDRVSAELELLEAARSHAADEQPVCSPDSPTSSARSPPSSPRGDQPRDRGPAVRQRQDRRGRADPDLPQARRPVPGRRRPDVLGIPLPLSPEPSLGASRRRRLRLPEVRRMTSRRATPAAAFTDDPHA